MLIIDYAVTFYYKVLKKCDEVSQRSCHLCVFSIICERERERGGGRISMRKRRIEKCADRIKSELFRGWMFLCTYKFMDRQTARS